MIKIVWNIRVPYDDENKIEPEKIAKEIWESYTMCTLPPNKIIIETIGYGNYVYDLLLETYHISVMELKNTGL